MVGEPSSGKSTLINKLIGKDATEVKPTVGMEYNYGRKTVDGKKEVANYYEVAGGREAAKMLRVPFNKRGTRFENTVFVVVCDLSKPGNVLPDLDFWLNEIRAAESEVFSQIQTEKPERGTAIETKCNAHWNEHEDA